MEESSGRELKVFSSLENSIQREWIDARICEDDLTCKTFENAYILPSVARYVSGKKLFDGGVCGDNFKFIAGYCRARSAAFHNFTCISSYTPTGMCERLDEDVIFCGVAIDDFGHFLTDSMSRMWYPALEDTSSRKLVFMVNNVEFDFTTRYGEIFEGLGIDRNRLIFLKKPTRFKSVCVPDQSMHFFSDINLRHFAVFDRMWQGDSIEEPSSKVYLSRSKIKTVDCFNEQYFENFFAKNGYKIIHPQELSFREQVLHIRAANEVASTVGTLTHLLLFAKKGSKAIELIRSGSYIPRMQLLIDKGRGLSPHYINATLNILPQQHDRLRAFYLGKTLDWAQFCEDQDFLSYSNEDLKFDWSLPGFEEYIRGWIGQVSKRPSLIFENLKIDIFDAVKRISLGLDLDSFTEVDKLTSDPILIGKRILGKKFRLYISRDGIKRFSRDLILESDGKLTTIYGDSHKNESNWGVRNGRLIILDGDNKVTHTYDHPDMRQKKLSMKGIYVRDESVSFHLDEL